MKTPQLARQLAAIGFKPEGGDYLRNGLRARFESRWLTIETPAGQEGELISEASGAPGLWKSVRSPSGRLKRVFDLPLATVAEQETWDNETGDAQCPLDEMIGWVDATSSGKLSSEWKPPPRKELEASLPSNAFTVEIGPFARQGRLDCEGSRLSVSLPVLQRLPTDLSRQRRTCLDKLLAEVQNRSRLVRLVESKTAAGVSSVFAEVDLSGAPRFALSLLLRISLDAVRHVVSQNISAVELLVDPTVMSTVWEIPSVQESPAEGSQK